MINEEKVRLMTKLSIYEAGKGKETIPISQYFKEDYISKELIKSFVAGTIAYGLGIVLLFAYQMETFVDNFVGMDINFLITAVLVTYIAFIFLYLLVTFVISSVRYKKAQKSLKAYDGILKKIEGIYTREESDTKPIKW